PVFYVAEDASGNWAVVDGIQRLTTIFDFVTNQYQLEKLEYLTNLNDSRFEDLPRPMQRRIEETSLVINIIQDGTPEPVMINIFNRINTGGLPLSAQEVRNALYKGDMRKLLQNLAKSPEFAAATANSIDDKRMGAQELILRFLSFYKCPWQSYVQEKLSLDEFLNREMQELSGKSLEQLEPLAKIFKHVMHCASQLFGDNAFRKFPNGSARRSPVNRALFDSIGVTLAGLSDKDMYTLLQRKQQLSEALRALLADERFDKAISSSTGSLANVQVRFAGIESVFSEVLK
ncbi:MAG: DUF262 domain-containing protein, partial [Burkholderiales bacterium]|nr:DUF262 domain-containing protein [Burkholderiales bacterium]